MIVLDASAAICILLTTPLDRAYRLEGRLHNEDLYAPHLIDLEVVHALRRSVLRRDLSPARADEALSDLAGLPLERYPHFPFLEAIWRMRANRTAYDAAYIALAEALGAPVITLDVRMARTPAAVPIEVY